MKISKIYAGAYSLTFTSATARIEVDEKNKWNFVISFKDGNKVKNDTEFVYKKVAIEKIKEIVGEK
jgi:hypothetical protein